jgi:ketosteroid isomerase-like protein
MSEENVEVARKVLGEFNAFMRDELSSEALAEAYDPRVEIYRHDRQTYPGTPQRLRGLQDLIAFTEEYRDGWADLTAEVLELTEAPDGRILVFVRSTARGRQSGVPIELHYFAIYTIQDAEVRRVEYFRHRADALEAAGLRE